MRPPVIYRGWHVYVMTNATGGYSVRYENTKGPEIRNSVGYAFAEDALRYALNRIDQYHKAGQK